MLYQNLKFTLEKLPDENDRSVTLDTLVATFPDGKKETWCTVKDLDLLFETCHERWGFNWNLEKVLATIEETDID